MVREERRPFNVTAIDNATNTQPIRPRPARHFSVMELTDQPILCLLEDGEDCGLCGEIVDGVWEVEHSPGGRCDEHACTQCWRDWTSSTADRDYDHVRCICSSEVVSLWTIRSVLDPPDFEV